MARSFTVAQLIVRIRERADIEGMNPTTGFADDAEIIGYLNASYTELWDILVGSGLAYHEATQQFTSTTSDTYPLPADYYGTIGVDYQWNPSGSGYWLSLRPMLPSERNMYGNVSAESSLGFRIVDVNLQLFPPPSAGKVYRHLYIPCAPTLDDVADTVDGVNGWEEYLVEDCARKYKVKEESDTSPHDRALGLLRDRIRVAAENREMGIPRHVAHQSALVDLYIPGDYVDRVGVKW